MRRGAAGTAIYPEETEDVWLTEPRQLRAVENSPGWPDISLVVLLQNKSAYFSGIPAGPVAEPPATVRSLGWDPVESGGPGSPYAPAVNLTPGVAAYSPLDWMACAMFVVC